MYVTCTLFTGLYFEGERRDAVNLVESQLEDVQELLDQMELSVRELGGGQERTKYEHRLRSYAADAEQLKKALVRLNVIVFDVFYSLRCFVIVFSFLHD